MSAPQSIVASASVDISATTVLGIVHGLSGEYLLKSLTFVPAAATAADGSNKYVLAFDQASTAVGTSLDSSSAAFVAGAAQAVTLTAAAAASLEFGTTDVLKITCTETGTATMAGTFFAAFEKVRV